ncbi:MAG: alpha-amylase family glycosyl hydrolase [Mucinivorans sp.]
MSQLLFPIHSRQGKKHPTWSYEAVIYEFNVRQFTPQGTFDAAQKHLPRLRAMGIDILWMMPIFPIGELRRKGSLGSYYSIKDYTAVNHEFGTMEDFIAFIDHAHSLGMYVILDWVANHTSRDAVWTTNKNWYEWDSTKNEIATPFDWSDTAKLDYSNPQMRHAMVEAMIFWLTKAHIDGFRMDMAMLVPTEFWEWATPQLEDVRADLFMLAEAEGVEFHHRAFDATYGWQMHHLLNDIAQGKCNAHSLRAMISNKAWEYGAEPLQMQFTSNHDENSWNGTEYERMGDAALQMTALTFILHGMPMIYSGQETALNRRLQFFDKDCIEWQFGQDVELLYSKLCALKHSHPALGGGAGGADIVSMDCVEDWRVVGLKRKIGDRVVMGVFNFSNSGVDTHFSDEDFNGQYNDLTSTQTAHLQSDKLFWLPAHGWYIYYK